MSPGDPKMRIIGRRILGLPKGLWRRVKRAPKRLVTAFRDLVIVEVASWFGVHVSRSGFDPDAVRQYAPVGQCIYCGKFGPNIKLTGEHILAYALGGDAILPEASCTPCQRIIEPIETRCVHEIFSDIRTHHGIHSRTGHPDELEVYDQRSPTNIHRVLVPIGDHPGMLAMPSFAIPGLGSGQEPSHNKFKDLKIHVYDIASYDDDKRERLRSAGVGQLWVKKQIDPFVFARVLAKTAHCIAVAECGLSRFRPLLEGVILRAESVPYYVGCAETRMQPPYPMRHWARVEYKKVGNTTYLVVFLRLFAYVAIDHLPDVGTPIYVVVVGEVIPWRQRLARWLRWPECNSDRTPSPKRAPGKLPSRV